MNATLEHDLHEQLERLSPEAQRRVLEYARELEQQHSGDQLLSLAGSMSREEATEMQQMLEHEFGQVWLDDFVRRAPTLKPVVHRLLHDQ